jgi:hypothetical protein
MSSTPLQICMPLLTGKQPNELYDSYSNSWNWRGYAQVSDRLEAVFNRMLQSSPSQRFQSANEVLAALTPPRPAPVPSPAPVSAPLPTPLPSPAPIQAPTPTAKPVPLPPPARPPFTLVELLGGAAFTGFEGGLLTIALTSLMQISPVGLGISLLLISGLVFAQSRRVIEKLDLAIIAGITLGMIFFVPALQLNGSIQATMILAVFAGLLATAVAILFRLVYSLLSRIV